MNRLTPDDEGALVIQVKDYEGRVVVGFNKAITWLGFDPDQALDFANCVAKIADELKEKKKCSLN